MKRISSQFCYRLLVITAILALIIGITPSQPARGSAQVIFDSIPATLPGSFLSQGYAANGTDEVGDQISFASADNQLTSVTVSLTNWACENDFDLTNGVWVAKRGSLEACQTTPGSAYNHPITLNLYNVDHSGANPAVGSLIATKTATFSIPFRPSYDAENCPASGPVADKPFGGTWYDPVTHNCVHGRAFTIPSRLARSAPRSMARWPSSRTVRLYWCCLKRWASRRPCSSAAASTITATRSPWPAPGASSGWMGT